MFGLSHGGTEAATVVLELGRQPSIIRRAERKLLQAAAAPPHVSSIYDIVILVFVAVGQDFPPRYHNYALETHNIQGINYNSCTLAMHILHVH